MRRLLFVPCILLLAVAQYAVAADTSQTVDVRRGVPDDVYLVVYGKHNPERDYQRQYYEAVWKTVQETQIIDDVIKMVKSNMSADDFTKAEDVIKELREAVKPIDLQALADAQEVVYAQWMQMWTIPDSQQQTLMSQHLVIVRATPEVAASTAEGIKNLFALAEKHAGGDIGLSDGQEGEAKVYGLVLPPQSPMQPAVAHVGDLFLFCSSKDLLHASLKRLAGGEGACKFDDPRLKAALEKLPAMEDSLVFYDGKAQFATLRGLSGVLRQAGQDDPNVERAAKILDKVWDDVGILDYEVTVEYTEGNLNRSASYGKLLPGTDDATLRKMVSGGQPFEKWYGWVPAGALSYSMGTGASLHPLYERIMTVVSDDVPEAAPALEKFEAIQAHYDLYLDRDILQAFSGEHVSVAMPSAKGGQPESVMALRCTKPDRIKELLHRGMDALQQVKHPLVQAQQPKFVESEELEGFEVFSTAILGAFQVRPVIGFKDDWMYIGSSAGAVQKVLDTKAGNGETMEGTAAFQKLKLDVEGPVDSIAYTNTAEQTRALAGTLEQLGIIVPTVIAMAGASGNQEEMKPIQAVLTLLPDVAKIVRKFDFLEANMTVAQRGDEPDSYVKRSVTVVRPVEEPTAESASTQEKK